MKNIPQRTCTVCRKQKNKNELLRIVKNKENIIKVDAEWKRTRPWGLYLFMIWSALKRLKKSKKTR